MARCARAVGNNSGLRGERKYWCFENMNPSEFLRYVSIHEGDEPALIRAWDYFANQSRGEFAERVERGMTERGINPHIYSREDVI